MSQKMGILQREENSYKNGFKVKSIGENIVLSVFFLTARFSYSVN